MNTAFATSLAHKGLWKIKNNAPRILFATGIVGSVSTVVLASRAGAKSVPVVDELAQRRTILEDALGKQEISEEEHALGVKQEYARTGIELGKLYAPVVIVGVTSLVCITKSHMILSERNAALTVAVTSLDRMIKTYRGRVVQEFGEEKDLELLHGTVTEEIETTNSKGQKRTKKITKLDPEGATPYSIYFNASNIHWDKDPGYNQNYLANQQTWANLKLKSQGFLFLNDVLDYLGYEKTHMGQIVGWISNPEPGEGDGYVDFGFNKYGEFVAGYERDVWLDFNVDGPILDKIA